MQKKKFIPKIRLCTETEYLTFPFYILRRTQMRKYSNSRFYLLDPNFEVQNKIQHVRHLSNDENNIIDTYNFTGYKCRPPIIFSLLASYETQLRLQLLYNLLNPNLNFISIISPTKVPNRD